MRSPSVVTVEDVNDLRLRQQGESFVWRYFPCAPVKYGTRISYQRHGLRFLIFLLLAAIVSTQVSVLTPAFLKSAPKGPPLDYG